MKHKMLSLEKLKDLPDFVKEDYDDDEVTGKLISTKYDFSFSLSISLGQFRDNGW